MANDETSDLFAPGSLIAGRYQIERRLGEGGFAVSWLVLDQQVDRRRVIKQYKDAIPYEKAKKEYNSAEKLTHARCARVWDIRPNPLILVTEYVEGESLASASQSKIEAEDYRNYALDILDALIYMHENDVLHNDITPGNIVIEPEGHACLIDFGLARSPETKSLLGLTPFFAAPEVLTGGRTVASDLYGLGATFLKSMLQHSPFNETASGDADKANLRALSDDDRAHLGPLGCAIAEQFFRLIAYDPSERPSSSREFAEDLSRAAAIEIESGGRNINPTVDSLRQLYRGSRLGNSGNRGLETPFAMATYVDTLLDTELTPKIVSGELELVILTGNPGDGKTSYLKKLHSYLADAGALLVKEGAGGWICETPNRTFAAVYDASEARDGKSSDELIIEALTPVREGTAHTALLAINDGRLRQFFVRDYSDLFENYRKAVVLGLGGKAPEGESKVAYVDLKRRSLAPTYKDASGIAGRTLDTFTDSSRWSVCNTCSAREVCPILRNRSQLRGIGRSRLLKLVGISHLRRQRRATFRDFRSAAGWVITGDRGCSDIHDAIDQGMDLRRGADALHFDLAFDHHSTDYLVAEWSDLDPSLLPAAQLERDDRVSAGHETWYRRESLNRRAFFGDLECDDSHMREATPYRYLDDFQGALEDDVRTQKILPRILVGLSRLLGAFGYEGENLALQDGQNDGWAVLREMNAGEFTLERRPLPSPYVEQQADEFLLSHPRARLTLTLDSVEMVLRAADGELINDAAANAIKLELMLFASRLMLHPASAAIIVNPAGAQYTVTETKGKISLGGQK